jgi:16S rRNA (cytosine1402-N4)-methyltransferase
MEQEHKRRVRYRGTHPRKFEEKYKEHQPEKYKDDVEKIIQGGKTPAGMHISIMVDEILEVLKIQPGEKGLDATLGYGGHSSKMLEALKGEGHLYSLDIDPIEIVKTKARLEAKGYGEDILTIIRTNFRNIDEVAGEHGKFNFLMADLGVSSMQIDNPERGFTYKHEGPLDLRLDPTKGVSAAERLKELTADEIDELLDRSGYSNLEDYIAETAVDRAVDFVNAARDNAVIIEETYEVDGNVITLGDGTEIEYNIFRDEMTFEKVKGESNMYAMFEAHALHKQ